MTLFSKPIDSITYEDVVSFCQLQIKETVNLDYKLDFPNDLAKTISAFANTYGGLLLIGVDEMDGRPKPPYVGLDYMERLQERVINVCIDSIYPPIVPEVAVCASPDKKAFVVVRVPESLDTPHAIQSNSRAYIRTGNTNKPEDSLTFDQLEWLIKRREKSIELRQSLYENASQRLSNLLQYRKGHFSRAVLKMFSSPSFPHSFISDSPDFLVTIAKCSSHNPRNFEFPPSDSRARPINGGMYAYDLIVEMERSLYFELTQYGSVYTATNLDWKSPGITDRRNLVWMERLVTLITQFLDFVACFYARFGYHGYTYLHFSISDILGMHYIPLDWGNTVDHPLNVIEDNIKFILSLSSSELSDTKLRTAHIAELLEKISWSFGHSIPLDRIEAEVKKCR